MDQENTNTASVLEKNLDHLPVKSSRKSLDVILGVLAIFLVGLSAFLYLENTNLKKQLGITPKPLLGKSCEYNGATYKPGDGFTATDGCNSCTCSETGEVACTLMACENKTSITDQTSSWSTYTAPTYSFKYPSNLYFEVNPRNFTDSTPVYFFISDKIRKEYLDCLETGKKQADMYRQNITVNDWVDWEGDCDVGKVLYQITVNNKKNEFTGTLYQQLNDQSFDNGIKINKYSVKGIDWLIEDAVWGMGGTVEVQAELNDQSTYTNISIRTNSESLETYTKTPMMLRDGDQYDMTPTINHMNDFIRTILSTFEFTE